MNTGVLCSLSLLFALSPWSECYHLYLAWVSLPQLNPHRNSHRQAPKFVSWMTLDPVKLTTLTFTMYNFFDLTKIVFLVRLYTQLPPYHLPS